MTTAATDSPARGASPRTAPATGRLVLVLATVTFLQWLAASLVLPLLPNYLQQRGASGLMIGLAMAAFFAGALAAQYPLGRLSDRVPPRTLLIAAISGYALATAAFLIPAGPEVLIGIRAAQGATAGAVEVIILALIGRAVPEARRTGAYAAIFAAQTAGLAIGPLLAGVAGTGRMTTLFVLATGVAVLAGVPLLGHRRALPSAAPPRSTRPDVRNPGQVPLRRIRALRAIFAAAAITGLTSGVYEACWTLLLDQRGATSWQVGLSWSLFSLPFILVSTLAGRVTNRLKPHRILLVALACSLLLVALYPFIASIPVVIALGAVEGAATALAYPAAQTMLSRHSPAGRLGQTQGTFATIQTACIALAAAAGGALFSLAAWLPFVCVAAVGTAVFIAFPSRPTSPTSDRVPQGRHPTAA